MTRIIRIIIVLLLTLACWHPSQAQTHFTEVAHQAGVADSVGANADVAWGEHLMRRDGKDQKRAVGGYFDFRGR